MDWIIQLIVAIAATLGFAVLFTAPRKELLLCGLTGGLGWIVYLVLTRHGMSVVIASGIASLCLTIIARIFAVIRRTPVTVYLMAGIFPLVPGAGIYYTAYYLFINNPSLSSSKAVETFEIAGMIVIGIVFGFAIPQKLFKKLRR